MCYSYVLVCTHMSSVCHLYILVCHPYVTRMYLYVILMSLVCGFTMNRKNIFSFAVHIYGCSFVAKLVQYFFFFRTMFMFVTKYILFAEKSLFIRKIYIYIYRKNFCYWKKLMTKKLPLVKLPPGRLPEDWPPTNSHLD